MGLFLRPEMWGVRHGSLSLSFSVFFLMDFVSLGSCEYLWVEITELSIICFSLRYVSKRVMRREKSRQKSP